MSQLWLFQKKFVTEIKVFAWRPRSFFLLLITAPLLFVPLGCKNPAEVTEAFTDAFRREYPKQEVDYQSSTKQIRYAWTGSPEKRPLLFIHGSPGNWSGWSQFLMDRELQDQFHVLAVDRPGFGGSEPGSPERSLASQTENIVRILDTNQSGKKAILVGHSFGGPVIARMAIDFQQRIAGLVFVASSVDPDLETTQWFQYPAQWVPFRWLIPTDLKVCNEEILSLKSELTAMLPEWPKIEKMPSVIIQGDDDPLVPAANADFLAARISPEAMVQKQRVPGLNHFVPWLRPDLILEGIESLRSRLEAGRVSD